MRYILAFLISFSCCASDTITVIGNNRIANGQPYSGKLGKLQFTPLSCPQAIWTNTYWPQAVAVNLTNGPYSVSLIGGWYDTGILPETTQVRIFVDPAATNSVQFNDCALLATNTSFFFITNPLTQFIGTAYVVTALGPYATKTVLNSVSNSLYASIQAAAGAAGVSAFNARTGMVILVTGDVTNVVRAGSNITYRVSGGNTYIDTTGGGGGNGQTQWDFGAITNPIWLTASSNLNGAKITSGTVSNVALSSDVQAQL